MFRDCSSLKTVYLSDTVTQLGDYAFANCKSLSSVIGGAKNLAFKPHTFQNCESLFDYRFTLLDPSSYLTSNADLTSINGMVNYTVRYQLKDNVANSSQNHQLSIEIPEGMTIIPESISSNVIDEDSTDLTSGEFYVTKPKGIVKFSCRILEYGEYSIAARLSFDYNDEWWTETIGTLDVDVPKITCNSVGTTNSYSIDVHGIAEKGADVALYIDDKKATTIKANEYTGKYSTTLSLPEKESGSTYNIYAQSSNIISDEITITYEANKPAIKSVTLIYNGNQRADITNVFTEGASPVFTLTSTDYQFEIEADHNDQIFRMYVTSTKGKETRHLEAKWDSEKQLWVTDGYFDPENTSYIVGSLNISVVSYKTDTEQPNSHHEIKLSEATKANSTAEIIEQNEDGFHARISLSNGNGNNNILNADIVLVKESNDLIPYNISPQAIESNPEKYGFKKINSGINKDGKKQSVYARALVESDFLRTIKQGNDLFSGMNDLFSGQTIMKCIENDISYGLGDTKIFEFYNYYIGNVTGDLITAGLVFAGQPELAVIHEALKTGIALADDTTDYILDLAKANGNIDYMIYATDLFFLKCLNDLSGVFPMPTFIQSMLSELYDLLDEYLDYAMETGEPIYLLTGLLKLILDPSGYVYEAIDSNRIKDAKLTIYYKDSESGDAVLWNAEDYDQSSTLYSASDGSYAWDVPEGLWKVVCEKEGYDTVESEWVNVPPVQTDINFSIVSHDVPAIIDTQIVDNVLTVTFSKYMIDKSVSSDSIQLWQADKQITCTIKPVKEQGNNSGFSNTYQISTTEQVNWNAAELKTTADAKSYAEVPAVETRYALFLDTVQGDVNEDGSVNASDAQMALGAYAELIAGNEHGLTDTQFAAADVDGNGDLSAMDAQNILTYFLLNNVLNDPTDWGTLLAA